MPMKCKEIVKEIHKLAPAEYAEEWDNVGLIMGDGNSNINKVLVCLETTGKIIEEAIAGKCEMIVAHHPFIYKPLKNILANDVRGRMVYELIRNNISLFCAHTNLDKVAGGIGEILAELMELRDVEVLDERCLDDIYPLDICKKDKGLGRVGNLHFPLKSGEFIDRIKRVFNTQALRLIGNFPDEIRRVAIFNGSYDKTLYHCIKKKADVLITGDVKYHDARDIVDAGFCAVDAGHYESENAAMERFTVHLSQKITEVEFVLSKEDINPFKYIL